MEAPRPNNVPPAWAAISPNLQAGDNPSSQHPTANSGSPSPQGCPPSQLPLEKVPPPQPSAPPPVPSRLSAPGQGGTLRLAPRTSNPATTSTASDSPPRPLTQEIPQPPYDRFPRSPPRPAGPSIPPTARPSTAPHPAP